eukprot:756023-Hanusia_phi.AAC.3
MDDIQRELVLQELQLAAARIKSEHNRRTAKHINRSLYRCHGSHRLQGHRYMSDLLDLYPMRRVTWTLVPTLSGKRFTAAKLALWILFQQDRSTILAREDCKVTLKSSFSFVSRYFAVRTLSDKRVSNGDCSTSFLTFIAREIDVQQRPNALIPTCTITAFTHLSVRCHHPFTSHLSEPTT